MTKENKITHKIYTFDVDDNGCIKNNTLKIMNFSGTNKEAEEKGKQWKAQRDKEEPLGVDEEWGTLKYICHVWTLDELGNEDYYTTV